MKCPCCSQLDYENCCEPIHKKVKNASSAEQLMRSRYSAFALHDGKYLWETTAPLQRKFHLEKEYQSWAEANKWISLEIINLPRIDEVEFKAIYQDENGQVQVHYELSKFEHINGKWYYVSGKFWDQ